MRDIFLDTVGMIAVWDDTDQWHADAKAAYDLLFGQGRKLVTTSLVLYECGNASAQKLSYGRLRVAKGAQSRSTADRTDRSGDRNRLGRLRTGRGRASRDCRSCLLSGDASPGSHTSPHERQTFSGRGFSGLVLRSGQWLVPARREWSVKRNATKRDDRPAPVIGIMNRFPKIR